MPTRITASLLLAIALVVQPSTSAFAACDTTVDLEAALVNADSVFVAQIVGVSDGGATAEASVKAVWKGPDLEQKVTLSGGDSADTTSGITRIHAIGQTYLVVASWSRSAFVDDRCTATQLYSRATHEIPLHLQEAVGAEAARSPLAAEPVSAGRGGFAGRVFIALGIITLLGVLGAIALDRMSRYRSPRGTVDRTEPKKPAEPQKQPKWRKRTVAGWASGRFSRSGKKQVDHLKKR